MHSPPSKLNENRGQDTEHVGSQENGASYLMHMLHDLIMATVHNIISVSSGLSGLSMVGSHFEQIGGWDRWDGLAGNGFTNVILCLSLQWN